MAPPKSRLAKLESPHGHWTLDTDSGIEVYHVDNQHTFTQAAGYLKHVLAAQSGSVVYYRGQTKIYPTLIPSLYRRVSSQKVKSKRDEALANYLDTIDREKNVLRAVPKYAREPLLQHYGIRTKWLDLVDNIWVALWFACHEAKFVGALGRYLHFEPRKASGNEAFAYILMVASPVNTIEKDSPGLYRGSTSEIVDLRVAVPSTYVRPHAQHALLFRRWKGLDHNNMDYSPYLVGIIRVTLADAVSWLGRGELVAIHSLFPPPAYDYGYLELLTRAPAGAMPIGTIHNVGA